MKELRDFIRKSKHSNRKYGYKKKNGKSGQKEIKTEKFSIEKRNEKLKMIFEEATS